MARGANATHIRELDSEITVAWKPLAAIMFQKRRAGDMEGEMEPEGDLFYTVSEYQTSHRRTWLLLLVLLMLLCRRLVSTFINRATFASEIKKENHCESQEDFFDGLYAISLAIWGEKTLQCSNFEVETYLMSR